MDKILEDLIKETYNYQKQVDVKAEEIKKLDEQLKALKLEQKKYQDVVDANRATLLNYVKDDNPVEVGDIVVQLCHTTTTGYSDEAKVIAYLKEQQLTQFIKVTEAIKKQDLNKELKINQTLKESLSPYTAAKTTDYVVVTDKENHAKMMEHRKGD